MAKENIFIGDARGFLLDRENSQNMNHMLHTQGPTNKCDKNFPVENNSNNVKK